MSHLRIARPDRPGRGRRSLWPARRRRPRPRGRTWTTFASASSRSTRIDRRSPESMASPSAYQEPLRSEGTACSTISATPRATPSISGPFPTAGRAMRGCSSSSPKSPARQSPGVKRVQNGSIFTATAWHRQRLRPRHRGRGAPLPKARRLRQTGRVNQRTFSALVAPMRAVLRKPVRKPKSLGIAMLICAKAHLAQSPREVGGPNRGPWVRLYTGGNEGDQWAWCAGFVTFILKQASELMGAPMPIAGSVGCDQLAAQAKQIICSSPNITATRRFAPAASACGANSDRLDPHRLVVEIHPEFFPPSKATPTTTACGRPMRSAR